MAKKKVKKAVKKSVVKKPASKKKAVTKASKKPAARPAKKIVKKAVKKVVKKIAKAVKKPAKKAASLKPVAQVIKKATTINPYLNFNGNCEEAFNFYLSVFGGKFSNVSRFNSMPPMEGQPPIPESEGNKIMHIALPISQETILMGSDTTGAFGPTTIYGNNFSLSLNTVSQSDADRMFNGLSNGGQVVMPMAKTFWGSYFGMLVDKFGIHWMISFEQGQNA
jgi:PhnB protein